MPVVSSRYWNMVHGNTPEEVRQDQEGLSVMRTLAHNMAWLLKSIQAGRDAGLPGTRPGAAGADELYSLRAGKMAPGGSDG